MFQSRIRDYESDVTVAIRKDVFAGPGYYVIKNFVDRDFVDDFNRRWFSDLYNHHFTDFVKNVDVTIDSPHYMYKRPGPDDRAYCLSAWNAPVDEIGHNVMIEANQLRNIVEGRPLPYGTRRFDDWLLQYRICRTVSSGQAVKPHADYMEEYRHDPGGDHGFDPRRTQLTLFLSDYGPDYVDGGFKFTTNQQDVVLFGRDVDVGAGDLVIWKYTNVHEVSDVQSKNLLTGFARIIFPMYQGLNNYAGA